ncbi:MAG: tryptophan--tRNA ligase [Clostridia bacterium]|nr:tryptophan--tRNA ligase [Clostridia bacterium]
MEINMDKKTIFSGVQPSGNITLGNYLGAIKNWVGFQEDYNCIYAMMDMHAITVRQNPQELRRRTLDLLKIYIACGIDPEKSLLFVQSHVSEHAQLAWVLNCYTYMGELSRMTQFKDKSSKHADNINAGLFTYPVLMAADILLYQADLVPVGKDQMQHIEITRDIAERFNSIYCKEGNPVFKVPEGFLPKAGAKVMSLTEPTKKMSKSDENPKAYISILDDFAVISNKIKSAVTDSEGKIEYRPEDETKAGINNLLTIMAAVTGSTEEKIAKEFSGKGYGDFKKAVAEAVVEEIRPIRARYDELSKSKDYLEEICKAGSEKAEKIAAKTLGKVYKKIGFLL